MVTTRMYKEGRRFIVNIGGKMVFDALHPLNSLLKDLVSDRQVKLLVLNLEEVSCVDSSGIGYLVAFKNAMSRNMGHVCLCWLSPAIQLELKMMNLLNFFPIYSTLEDAIRDVNQHPPFGGTENRGRRDEEPGAAWLRQPGLSDPTFFA